MSDKIIKFPKQIRLFGIFNRLPFKLLKHQQAPNFFAIVCLLLLLVCSSWLYYLTYDGLPLIKEGVYLGKFKGIVVSGTKETEFLLKASSNSKIEVYFNDKNNKSVTLRGRGEKTTQLKPLLLTGGKYEITLRGVEDQKSYQGVYRTANGHDGLWSITQVSPLSSSSVEDSDLQDIDSYISLLQLQDRYDSLNKNIESIDKELSRMKLVLDSPDKERNKVEEKIKEQSRKLDKLKNSLKDKESESKKFWNKVLLSQKVTSYGNLVSLSREISDKENRWYDSMLRSGSYGSSDEMQRKYQRALKIQATEQELIRLTASVERLRLIKRRYQPGSMAN